MLSITFDVIKHKEFKRGKDHGMTTHGQSRTPLYSIWSNMLTCCHNTKVIQYKWFGGSGITVCESWLKFENFWNDVGNRPEGMVFSRKDKYKGYFKDNCFWISPDDNKKRKRRRIQKYCPPSR